MTGGQKPQWVTRGQDVVARDHIETGGHQSARGVSQGLREVTRGPSFTMPQRIHEEVMRGQTRCHEDTQGRMRSRRCARDHTRPQEMETVYSRFAGYSWKYSRNIAALLAIAGNQSRPMFRPSRLVTQR